MNFKNPVYECRMNEGIAKDFYVVSVITNPERFKTRARLFKEFMARMDKYAAKLYIVEGAFGDRDYEVTDPTNPRHIQVRTESEIWHKENLINIGISRLPADWKYVAWIDADVDFMRPDWIQETVHELQHNPVVQMFEDAIDMGPDHEILTVFKSFGYCYKNNLPRKFSKSEKPISDTKIIKHSDTIDNTLVTNPIKTAMGGPYYYDDQTASSPGTYWHPGYAWAATRDAINTMGGLFDLAILGAGDHHMACCLIGEGEKSIPKGIHNNYRKLVLAWQNRALRLHKNIGYVKGTICHYWHGKKVNRKYKQRWSILIENNYNPSADVHKDWQGVLTLYPGHETMRDQIREYFQSRNEDSIDKE